MVAKVKMGRTPKESRRIFQEAKFKELEARQGRQVTSAPAAINTGTDFMRGLTPAQQQTEQAAQMNPALRQIQAQGRRIPGQVSQAVLGAGQRPPQIQDTARLTTEPQPQPQDTEQGFLAKAKAAWDRYIELGTATDPAQQAGQLAMESEKLGALATLGAGVGIAGGLAFRGELETGPAAALSPGKLKALKGAIKSLERLDDAARIERIEGLKRVFGNENVKGLLALEGRQTVIKVMNDLEDIANTQSDDAFMAAAGSWKKKPGVSSVNTATDALTKSSIRQALTKYKNPIYVIGALLSLGVNYSMTVDALKDMPDRLSFASSIFKDAEDTEGLAWLNEQATDALALWKNPITWIPVVGYVFVGKKAAEQYAKTLIRTAGNALVSIEKDKQEQLEWEERAETTEEQLQRKELISEGYDEAQARQFIENLRKEEVRDAQIQRELDNSLQVIAGWAGRDILKHELFLEESRIQTNQPSSFGSFGQAFR